MRPTATEIDKYFFLWNFPVVVAESIDKASVLDGAMELLERPDDAIN